MPTPPELQSQFDTSQNIRDDITNLDDDALRASLKEFGWKRHLPAFVDENNVVLVGHRRMRIAAELGIEPHVVKLELGSGSAADAERRIIATTANIGFAEMSIASRRKLAVQFCQQGMTQAATAAMLGVNQSTIARDLETLCTPHKVHDRVDRLGRKNTGRPRGSGTKATKPKTTAMPADKPRAEITPQAADGAKDDDRLRNELAEAKAAATALAEELRLARNEIDMLQMGNRGLNRQITELNRQLKNKEQREMVALASDAPFTVRGAIAKALSEQHTSPEARLAALQAWNGLRANKSKRSAPIKRGAAGDTTH